MHGNVLFSLARLAQPHWFSVKTLIFTEYLGDMVPIGLIGVVLIIAIVKKLYVLAMFYRRRSWVIFLFIYFVLQHNGTTTLKTTIKEMLFEQNI